MVGPRIASEDEERAEVELLRARLEKTVQLTKKIKTSQARLETSGKQVQQAIGPIYGNTQRLQTLGRNIDRVCDAIEKFRQPLDARSREDRIIRAGPHSAGLPEYLASLRRINEALTGLKATNLRSNQEAIVDLKSLLGYGNRQVEDVFRKILSEDTRVIEPLHYITKKLPFPILVEDRTSTLAQIHLASIESSTADPAQSSHVSPTIKSYSDIRGPYLAATLQNLAAASLNTAKKRAPDAVYRRGSNGIGTYSQAMEGLFTAEYEMICQIYPSKDCNAVFRSTCRLALAEFAKTLGELNAHIQNNLITDCFLAYEIIDIVSSLSHRLEEKTGELKEALAAALKPVRDTAKASVRELLDDTRRRIMHLQALPSDGAVISVTPDTMMRLQNMVDFIQPLASVFASLEDSNWSARTSTDQLSTSSGGQKSVDGSSDANQLLSHYCLDTVEMLLQNLEAKGRMLLKQKNVLGVFLANNVAVVDRTIRTSELAPILTGSLSRLEAWRKKAVSLYLDSWKDPSAYLLDVQYTNRGGQRPASGSSTAVNSAEIVKALGNKEKDAIKDKFRGFNASFDELVARHRSLAMEREVRSQLAREVQAMIEPLYGRFWDRYHEIDKGKGKYVKFDKSQLAAILAALG